jgi:RND family efflux transporter MFP subunit
MCLFLLRQQQGQLKPKGASRATLCSAGLLAALLFAGCRNGQEAARAPKPIEVVVTRAIKGEVTDYQDFTGRLSAIKMVEIRARVSGYVKEAPFKEGDFVPKGTVLFLIDSTVYAAAMDKALADVALYEAQKRLLDTQYERNRGLVLTKAISRDEFDTTVALRDQAIANIAAAKANVKTARQNLDWTKVTAPEDGRISRRFVDPGNLVVADNTILTTTVSENPIYVYFDVDERTYLDLVEASSAGLTSWMSRSEYPLLMRLANEEEFSHLGTVNFVDNQVNANTGTIRLRGVFPNPTGILKPGLFARVRMPIGGSYKAVLIADEALQSDQGRKYVYVVDAKNEVVYRKVKFGQAVSGLRVIKDGLAEGERVIISGMQRVRPGSHVEVQEQPAAAPPDSPWRRFLTNGQHTRQGHKETRRQGDKETGAAGPELGNSGS